MNIVYGGSFNPPTLAHKNIVKYLIDNFNPNKVIIVPCGNNYNRKELLDFKYRFDMLKLTFDMNKVIISDIEAHNDKYLGTLDTLNKLSLIYDDIYFIMGADNIINIKTWIKYEELLDKYNFLVVNRDNINIYEFIDNNLSNYKDKIQIINLDYDISSSKVRNDLEKNKNLLDDKCYEYIINNNLYKG